MVAVFFFALYGLLESPRNKQSEAEPLPEPSEQLKEAGHQSKLLKSVRSSSSMEIPKKSIFTSSKQQVIEGINNSFEWLEDSRFRKVVK
jgi:hypothetical protein